MDGSTGIELPLSFCETDLGKSNGWNEFDIWLNGGYTAGAGLQLAVTNTAHEAVCTIQKGLNSGVQIPEMVTDHQACSTGINLKTTQLKTI